MKTTLCLFLFLLSSSAFAVTKSMERTDNTIVLSVDSGIKVTVVRYEDAAKGNTCYVMMPTGTYDRGTGSASPVSAVSGISCVKD